LNNEPDRHDTFRLILDLILDQSVVEFHFVAKIFEMPTGMPDPTPSSSFPPLATVTRDKRPVAVVYHLLTSTDDSLDLVVLHLPNIEIEVLD